MFQGGDLALQAGCGILIHMDSNEELARLAGLLEGEASFIAATEKYPVCLSLNMTDKDVVQYVADLWGMSVSRPKKQKKHHKQSYRCMVRGSKAIYWMNKVLPFMWERRTGQIKKAIKSHKPKGKDRKITAKQASSILERFSKGERAEDLAEEFSISKWMVYAIKQGRRSTG